MVRTWQCWAASPAELTGPGRSRAQSAGPPPLMPTSRRQPRQQARPVPGRSRGDAVRPGIEVLLRPPGEQDRGRRTPPTIARHRAAWPPGGGQVSGHDREGDQPARTAARPARSTSAARPRTAARPPGRLTERASLACAGAPQRRQRRRERWWRSARKAERRLRGPQHNDVHAQAERRAPHQRATGG